MDREKIDEIDERELEEKRRKVIDGTDVCKRFLNELEMEDVS